jgi:DNA helicase HerA-like ATPase
MANYSLEPEFPKGEEAIVAGDPGDRRKDRLFLGDLVETGRRRSAWLDISGEQVVAIVGKRGTGKSFTLGVLLEGLASGLGKTELAELSTPRAGLVLDIMDIFWTSTIPLSDNGPKELKRQYAAMREKGLSSRSLSVDVWIPAGFERAQLDPAGLRPLQIAAHDLELDDWAALFDVDIFTEPRGMLISDSVQLVARDGYDAAGGGRVSPNPFFELSDLVRCLEDSQQIATNYGDQTIRSVKQRLVSYAAMAVFRGPSTPLGDLLKPFRVSILMLARVPDELKSVIVSVLARRVLRERRDASFAQKRLELEPGQTAESRAKLEIEVSSRIPRTWILLDEAHVLASSGEGSVSRDALIKFAKEGRNYGLSLCVATQQPGVLDARLMSQVETMIIHQMTAPKDAEVATQNIRSPLPTSIRIDGEAANVSSLLRQLTPGTAIFSSGNAPKLPRFFVFKVRPRVTAHGGYEA